MARTELNDFECGLIGELGRRMISDPFSFLEEQMIDAWNEAEPGEALYYLADELQHAICCEATELRNVPRWLYSDGRPVRRSVLSFLDQTLEELGYDLVPLTKEDLPITSGCTRSPPAG